VPSDRKRHSRFQSKLKRGRFPRSRFWSWVVPSFLLREPTTPASTRQLPTFGVIRLRLSGSSASLGFPSCLGHSFAFFKDTDSNVAPPPYLGTAVAAGDETVICRIVWDDESIAATLTAPERGSVRVRLDRLRHDTASILVGRTTAGEKCGASLFSKRPLSRRIAKTRAHRREETNHG